MKGMFKRALAGVAAAALAATGLALAAGAANAVDADGNGVVTADATFTFTGSTEGKSLTAYKIADYVQYGTGPDFVYGVRTNADNKQAVETALAAAPTSPKYNAQTDGDAMAWAAQEGALDDDLSVTAPWSEGTTRAFARALAANAGNLKNGTKIDLKANTPVNLDAGVYLFVDATNSDYTSDKTDPIAMIVYSGEVNDRKLTDPTKGREIALKNYVTSVTMTANGKETTTASTGQDVTYTITGQMPVTTGDAATDDKSDYKFVDTPGAGQNIDFNSITVTVDTEIRTLVTDYVKPTKLDDNGSFTIDMNEWMKTQKPSAERKAIVVTYKATITAMEGAVTNTVAVYDNEAKAVDTTTVTLGGFSFTKTDAEGNHVGEGDATFKIAGKDGTATLTTDTASTNANGVVTFKGLADGTYTVTETANSEVYADYMAKFEVTITNGVATAMNGTDIYGLAGDATGVDAAATYTVKNVKNITQLPLTGAAGTALFTMLGLLIAGASALVYMKSRNVKHALRG